MNANSAVMSSDRIAVDIQSASTVVTRLA